MTKGGWTGKLLRVNLTEGKISVEDIPEEILLKYIGGRGLAVKYLWDELPRGIDPLSPENKLIFATGPLTGTPTTSSGKLLIAAKSPLTGGYGDGNVGTHVTVHLKKAGYDAIIFEGKSPKPVYLYIEDDKVELKDASEYWGKGTFEVIKKLKEKHGTKAGYLAIGPGGENGVRYAVIVSSLTRSGGRPGMGAVMGSKNLKAVVVKGTKDVPIYNKGDANKLTRDAIKDLKKSDGYKTWVAQGTMIAVEWSQENSVLPVHNFSDGVYEYSNKMDGPLMEKEYKKRLAGCPLCSMPCGNPIRGKAEYSEYETEMDYENIALLGSNLMMESIDPVIGLNYKCDDYGIDTISMGNTLGYVFELYEKSILTKDHTDGIELKFGDGKLAMKLIDMTAKREGFGDWLANGTKWIAEKLGGDAPKYAVHAKGLEVSGYDCHAAPGMALAYATSPIGAHHKDSWYIAQEVRGGRMEYEKWKAQGVIDLQRIRGGIFESLVACRLPWVELGLDLEYYPKYFKAITGYDMSLDDMKKVADRIYALIRSFWIREFGHWKREYDYPPEKWFITKLSKGPLAGTHLEWDKYNKLLDYYYEIRKWSKEGVPKKETLKELGLDFVIPEIEKYVKVE